MAAQPFLDRRMDVADGDVVITTIAVDDCIESGGGCGNRRGRVTRQAMDVKDAVAKAKSYLALVFSDENVSELRLEEVEYDRRDHAWLITLGLMRPSISGWPPGQIAEIMNTSPFKRTYKVVRIPDDEEEVPSIKIREFSEE